jgi:glutathione S-transferase
MIVDSKLICEYLIQASGRAKIHPEDHQIEYLSRAAITDGITEAALLMVY